MNFDQVWKAAWNAAIATVLSRIPGGNSCDPQQIADDIRELEYGADGNESEIDPYQVRIGGELVDPYRIAIEYDLDPVIAQAVKKLLRCGRKHKTAAEDVSEAITTLLRWQQIQHETMNEPNP